MSAVLQAPRRRALAPRVAAAALAASTAAGVGAGAALHFALRPSHASALRLPALHGQAVWPPHARPAPADVARRGRTAVVAFLGRRCDALCRGERRAVAQAVAQLAPAERPLVVFAPRSPARLARFASAFGVRASAHAIVLVDRRGDERTAYTAPFLPGFVAGDLAALAEAK